MPDINVCFEDTEMGCLIYFFACLFIIGMGIAVPIAILVVIVSELLLKKARRKADMIISGSRFANTEEINRLINTLGRTGRFINEFTEEDKVRISKLRYIRDGG